MSALNSVKKTFPQVEKVIDATEPIVVSVEDRDTKAGRKKSPSGCALARACIREKIADGAIIGLSVSYLIKGTTATRYYTSQAVAREIVSFDRHQDFAAGRDYLLSKVPKQARLGAKHRGTGPKGGKLGPRKRIYHRTEFVRQVKDR